MSITQECVVLGQGEGGEFIYADSFTTMYGIGETPEEAIRDYLDGVADCRECGCEYECAPALEDAWLWADGKYMIGQESILESVTKYRAIKQTADDLGLTPLQYTRSHSDA